MLYPEAHLANQVILVFILGGMILGAASILAPRPEAFLAFMVPSGFAPAVRLMVQADEDHLAMGFLAGLFTLATLITTRRIHLTIASSLNLQFENQDLVQDLQAAKSHAETLNEQLELRVEERTAELLRSTQQLRAEVTQRLQIEEELLRARKLESLGVMAGGIAHDFNNFLTVVRGNIELAKMRLDPDDKSQRASAQFRTISPGYFRTMGIPLIEGRFFTDQDIQGKLRVAIVNRTLARRFFEGQLGTLRGHQSCDAE